MSNEPDQVNPPSQALTKPTPTQQPLLPSQAAPTQEQLILARWMDTQQPALTNLATDDPDYEYLLLICAGDADRKTRNAVGEKRLLVGFAITAIELADAATGECLWMERVVLLCGNGETISTTASAVVRQVRILAKTRGKGRWNPPVECEILEKPLEGGKSYCTLRVSRYMPPAKNAKK